MKLTNITLSSSVVSNLATFSFDYPGESQPYIIKATDGLDAEEITPKYYDHTGSKKFYELGLKKRVIVIRIELNPRPALGETYSSLRDGLYRAISAARSGLVTLSLNNGLTPVASVKGFISKFEAPLFNKKPEVQITISCDDGLLRGPTKVELVAPTTIPKSDNTVIDSVSTAPHGVSLAVRLVGITPSFSINQPDLYFTVTPGVIGANTGFLTNDSLYLVNETTEKKLYMIRDGVTYHLAHTITPGSVWPVVFPGENTFTMSPTSFVWIEFTYYPAFWGV